MKTKLKILTIILVSTLILTACGNEEVPPSTEQPNQPTNTQNTTITSTNPTEANRNNINENETTSPDTTNTSPSIDPTNAQFEQVSGTVQSIGNGQFEIRPIADLDLEGAEEIGGMDLDIGTLMTIIIDENTLIETALTDGMNVLDRWESAFEDIKIGDSVAMYGFYIGDEFLATEIAIWSVRRDGNR